MVPETPSHLKSCWMGTQIRSSLLCVRSTHLIPTQLQIVVHSLSCAGRAGGAEWRCGDFELGRSGAWARCSVRGRQGECMGGILRGLFSTLAQVPQHVVMN